jgi:hypothetical protein
MAERELGVNHWRVAELHDRILWETLGQINRQCLSPTRVPCKLMPALLDTVHRGPPKGRAL